MTAGADRRLSIELLLLAALAGLWGSSYLFIKIALADIPPVTLIAARVAIAAAYLLVLVRLRGDKLPREPRTWRMLLVQAIFNSIGAWTVLAWGQRFVDSGLASVLNSMSPVFVLVINLLVTRDDAVGPLRLAGACLGGLGVVLIVGIDVLDGLGQEVAGQLAVLFGAMLYAVAAIYGKRFAGLPPTVTAAGTMIWATLCLVPVSLVLDQPWRLQPSMASLAAVLVLGCCCTGIALSLYFRLLATLGAMGVASQSYIRAGIGVILGVTVLGETISLTVGLGLIATVLGVALINLPMTKWRRPWPSRSNRLLTRSRSNRAL